MKNSNDLINKVNPALKTSLQKAEGKTNSKCETLSSEHLAKITQVWAWMEEMFSSKWQRQWGPLMENGQPTARALSWYEKTLKLTPKQWKCGFDRVERKITADIANDRDPWPPTTPGIFVAMCSPPQRESVGASGNAEKSYQEHPYIAEKKAETKRLEQPGYKDRQQEIGNKALNSIKDIF